MSMVILLDAGLETIRRFPGKPGVKLCILITAEFCMAETFY